MILCNYEAELDEKDPSTSIEYNLDLFESDLDLLKANNDHRYCLKKCHEMGHYLQTIRGLELVKIETEWFKDDNGYIWLFMAENICIRHQKNK